MFGINTIAKARISRTGLMAYAERFLWLVGILSLGLFFGLKLQQRAGAEEALRHYYLDQSTAGTDGDFGAAVVQSIATADKSTWSESRIAAFDSSAANAANSALAVLRIPRLTLETPIFAGAEEKELDRGPGWIRGTGLIGADGNIGIAGHRDGYFRALKDIQTGDVVEVLSPGSQKRYRVSNVWIVDPDAVHVLDHTNKPSLTLVTCYPFYFVGHAPKRFVVRAVSEEL